ncbi:hypothetical protein VZT92_002688 [Zoarces viviparus]|uniref:Secreted protein n=1 Tax=Zoarces viviparus TaxID=48416 RepID=A0AAW1G1V7_ZOAVI
MKRILVAAMVVEMSGTKASFFGPRPLTKTRTRQITDDDGTEGSTATLAHASLCCCLLVEHVSMLRDGQRTCRCLFIELECGRSEIPPPPPEELSIYLMQ